METVTQQQEVLSDLRNRFTFHPATPEQAAVYEQIRAEVHQTALAIFKLCPPSRERSLAFTHLDEVVMWANASIARHGEGA